MYLGRVSYQMTIELIEARRIGSSMSMKFLLVNYTFVPELIRIILVKYI